MITHDNSLQIIRTSLDKLLFVLLIFTLFHSSHKNFSLKNLEVSLLGIITFMGEIPVRADPFIML